MPTIIGRPFRFGKCYGVIETDAITLSATHVTRSVCNGVINTRLPPPPPTTSILFLDSPPPTSSVAGAREKETFISKKEQRRIIGRGHKSSVPGRRTRAWTGRSGRAPYESFGALVRANATSGSAEKYWGISALIRKVSNRPPLVTEIIVVITPLQ